MENPIPTNELEFIDSQKIDEFCQVILKNQGRGYHRFIRTEDGLLRRLPPEN